SLGEQRNTRQPNSPPQPLALGPPPVRSEMSDHVPSPAAQASACANPQSTSVYPAITNCSLSLLLYETSTFSASLRYLFFFPSLSSSAVPKQNHIPFLHYVLFPLQPHLRFLSRRPQTARCQQIIPSHHFRAYESLLDVAVD